MSHIVIDNSKCKSCYLCVDVCPKKLIKPNGETGKTGQPTALFEDNGECIACAQCAMVCPDLAIVKVVKE
jgi:2-oxoglutarate ferredoxin oxidoreductase subunit delta